MIVQLTCVKGYNYISKKDDTQKQGLTIDVCEVNEIAESDGKGNFTYGRTCANVFIPSSLNISVDELVNLVGHKVELVYSRRLGEKFDRLVKIKKIDEEEGGEKNE